MLDARVLVNQSLSKIFFPPSPEKQPAQDSAPSSMAQIRGRCGMPRRRGEYPTRRNVSWQQLDPEPTNQTFKITAPFIAAIKAFAWPSRPPRSEYLPRLYLCNPRQPRKSSRSRKRGKREKRELGTGGALCKHIVWLLCIAPYRRRFACKARRR